MKYTHEFYAPLGEDHPDYVADCSPDFHAQGIQDLNFEAILESCIEHVLLNWDFTLVANGQQSPDGPRRVTVLDLLSNKDLQSISIATSNIKYLYDEATILIEKYEDKLAHNIMRVFQPPGADVRAQYQKWDYEFWHRILDELGCVDTPETVLMVGDSHLQDIHTPKLLGIKTALVDRFMHVELFQYREDMDERFLTALQEINYKEILAMADQFWVDPLTIHKTLGREALRWQEQMPVEN
jgi:predicted HAD superfamily phosphohydrolase YqeG